MIGTKLAHYSITGHLGSGGMGDVYQATDSKLGREVAIKLLPEAFTHDADRTARFEREARILASLNPRARPIPRIGLHNGRLCDTPIPSTPFVLPIRKPTICRRRRHPTQEWGSFAPLAMRPTASRCRTRVTASNLSSCVFLLLKVLRRTTKDGKNQ